MLKQIFIIIIVLFLLLIIYWNLKVVNKNMEGMLFNIELKLRPKKEEEVENLIIDSVEDCKNRLYAINEDVRNNNKMAQVTKRVNKCSRRKRRRCRRKRGKKRRRCRRKCRGTKTIVVSEAKIDTNGQKNALKKYKTLINGKKVDLRKRKKIANSVIISSDITDNGSSANKGRIDTFCRKTKNRQQVIETKWLNKYAYTNKLDHLIIYGKDTNDGDERVLARVPFGNENPTEAKYLGADNAVIPNDSILNEDDVDKAKSFIFENVEIPNESIITKYGIRVANDGLLLNNNSIKFSWLDNNKEEQFHQDSDKGASDWLKNKTATWNLSNQLELPIYGGVGSTSSSGKI